MTARRTPPEPRARKWPPIPLSWEEQVALEALAIVKRAGWFDRPYVPPTREPGWSEER